MWTDSELVQEKRQKNVIDCVDVDAIWRKIWHRGRLGTLWQSKEFESGFPHAGCSKKECQSLCWKTIRFINSDSNNSHFQSLFQKTQIVAQKSIHMSFLRSQRSTQWHGHSFLLLSIISYLKSISVHLECCQEVLFPINYLILLICGHSTFLTIFSG